MKNVFNVLLVLLIIGCNRSEQAGMNIKREMFKIEKQIEKDTRGDENFNSFFEFFKKDTLFQLERTSVPFVTRVVLVTINAAGDMRDDIQTSSDKTEWEFAIWVSTKPQNIEIKKDSAMITFIDSVYVREFLSNHIFIKSYRKWYLKSFEIKQLPYIE